MKVLSVKDLVNLEEKKYFEISEKVKFEVFTNVRALLEFQEFMKEHPEFQGFSNSLNGETDIKFIKIILRHNAKFFLNEVIAKLPLQKAHLVMTKLFEFWMKETLGEYVEEQEKKQEQHKAKKQTS